MIATFWRIIEPGGRWICGVSALVIGLVRLLSLPAQPVSLMAGPAYAGWFLLAAVGLLLTAERPWSKRARLVAAMAAAPFIALGLDVIGRSVTSGVIPLLLAYRLAWEALRCRIG